MAGACKVSDTNTLPEYTHDKINVDLHHLCHFSDIKLINAKVYQITPTHVYYQRQQQQQQQQQLPISNHEDDLYLPICYDALSINVGITPTVIYQ